MITILLEKIFTLLSGYFTSIKNKLNYLYENISTGDNHNADQLLDRDNLLTNKIINNNGTVGDHDGWSASDFIDIRPYGNTIFFYGYDGLPYTCQYNENKEYVSGLRLNVGKNTYGSNVAYIRTSGGTQYLTSNDYAIFGEIHDS